MQPSPCILQFPTHTPFLDCYSIMTRVWKLCHYFKRGPSNRFDSETACFSVPFSFIMVPWEELYEAYNIPLLPVKPVPALQAANSAMIGLHIHYLHLLPNTTPRHLPGSKECLLQPSVGFFLPEALCFKRKDPNSELKSQLTWAQPPRTSKLIYPFKNYSHSWACCFSAQNNTALLIN